MGSKKETIIVTGSSGFIGYAACERLAHVYNVIGFDQKGAPYPPPSATRVDVDLTSDQSVKEALQYVRSHFGEDITSVLHLAAYYDFSGRPSSKYEEVTVHGTRRLLKALHIFNVRQFIFSSTMLVHAPSQPSKRINEEGPLVPKWDYPKSKLKTEDIIRRERGSIPIILARIAGVYNNHCRSLPLAHQIQRVFEGQLTSRFFPGDLSHGQSFLHIKDLVDLFWLAIYRRKELPSELALLVGEPETLSYGYLQNEFGRLIHNKEWKTFRIPKFFAKWGAWILDKRSKDGAFIKPWMIDIADDHYELDISLARRTLGWQPKISLRETLPQMIRALQANPFEWYHENHLKPPRWLRHSSRPAPLVSSHRD